MSRAFLIFVIFIGRKINFETEELTQCEMDQFQANNISLKKKLFLFIGVILLIWFYFSIPDPLFDKPVSTVLEASNGQILGAKIASDEQWRFPPTSQIPEKFEVALLTFEDKRFYSHLGIDFRAICRATLQNVRAKKIVSGGSTISMQVIRLSQGQKKRSFYRKITEAAKAIRLELKFSKKEILNFYASNAPFGGNVVGIDAASWRYFGKKTDQLSWSEAATLAVLPNSPSLIHPAKNRLALQKKRNRLLTKLLKQNAFDSLTYQLAVEEPLPDKPYPLPQLAPHLVQKSALEDLHNFRIKSSIDFELQEAANTIAYRNCQTLKNNEIHNLAIIVLDVETKEVIAYVGNEKSTGHQHSSSVDIIQAPRSSGSVLKPLLYAMMLQDGDLLPKSLVPDIPTYLKGFRPENFSETYDGAVPANQALSRSLNIPFVRMLQTYGVEKFHFNLKKIGLTTLTKEPNHYGLSLILGGAETTLWDLTNIYASMGKRLNSFYENSGKYNEQDFTKAEFHQRNSFTENKAQLEDKTSFLDASSIWLTFEAMKELERPNLEGDWKRFNSFRNIAWKTGTSYGFRDAWAIGVNPKFCVGVWVGNADGEGRPGITGIGAAAPVLFEVFDLLPTANWFDQPFDEMELLETCRLSGNLAKEGCPVDTVWGGKRGISAPTCNNHQLVFTDKSENWLVYKDCQRTQYTDSKAKFWFVLPPVQAHFYSPRHPEYEPLPPVHPDCQNSQQSNQVIQLIYPPKNANLLVPVELDGSEGKAVFKAVHDNNNSILHWHIDRTYIGTTKEIHAIEVSPMKGEHVLTVVDEKGNRVTQIFSVLTKEN